MQRILELSLRIKSANVRLFASVEKGRSFSRELHRRLEYNSYFNAKRDMRFNKAQKARPTFQIH